jgi:ribosomal protein L6P/L9E
MYKIRKKNQYKPYDIPYSVQITKNHSLLEFMGPCGHSSISRKKIDNKGHLLFNIDKKNFSFHGITFIRPLKSMVQQNLPFSCTKRAPFLREKFISMKEKIEESTNYIDVFEKNNTFWSGYDFSKRSADRDGKAAIAELPFQIFGKKKKELKEELFISYNQETFISYNQEIFISYFFPTRRKGDNYKKIHNSAIGDHSSFLIGREFKWGNQLLKNKMNGVGNGYSAFLQLIGLGYRLKLEGEKNNYGAGSIKTSKTIEKGEFHKNDYWDKNLKCFNSQIPNKPIATIAAGFSHKIRYLFPTDILVFVAKFPKNKICIFGIDKEDVNNCASQIKSIHPPTRYKGKGIRINNEVPLLRAGKKNK